ncbi:MAG: AMP-binding protein [Pseudomonadota bacterium]
MADAGAMGPVAGRAGLEAADTFPKLLIANAKSRAERPAIREKDYGIWQTSTWSEVASEVRRIACGLAELGLKRGDKLAIVGDNRPQLYWAIGAAQALGAVPVPVYQDAVADEMAFVIDHAEAKMAIAEDQEQVDKLLAIRRKNPRLGAIVYKDPRGLRNYRDPGLMSLDALEEMGGRRDQANPDFFLGEVFKGRGADVSIMLYTSGTTGQPKGVMLTYDNVMTTARNAVAFDRVGENEEVLAYLPMAWVGDHIYSYAEAYVAGFCVSCPESGATVLNDLREIGPTYFFAPPRIFENILTTVSIRIEDAAWWKRKMFHYFMDVGRRAGIPRLDGKRVGLADRLLLWAGEILVYGPLKNMLGLSRMRLGYTAGEAIGPDIFDFYRSLGLNLKQLYGMTETSVFICMQPDGQIKADTVGTPAPGVEIRIAESGEVMVKSPGVFLSYYKNDQATAEAKTADGWVRTGDAGFFDPDGHLKIIDRAKDVGRLADGTLFAPKYLENKLKFFPYIREAVAFGDRRDYVAAFISIDLEATGNWAERHGLAYASYQDLAARPEIYDLVQGCVEKVNRDLAADAKLAGSQIRRFLILHKELDADDGELTRTRKVRRGFIGDRYAPLVEGLYGAAERVHIEAQVTFEDGRKGTLKADLAIRNAALTHPPEPLRKAG